MSKILSPFGNQESARKSMEFEITDSEQLVVQKSMWLEYEINY